MKRINWRAAGAATLFTLIVGGVIGGIVWAAETFPVSALAVLLIGGGSLAVGMFWYWVYKSLKD